MFLLICLPGCSGKADSQLAGEDSALATLRPESETVSDFQEDKNSGANRAEETLFQAEKAVLMAYDEIRMPLGQYAYYYRAAWYAAWEALSKYPTDSRAETWKWKLAYYAALSGENELATNTYLELLTNALNDDGLDVRDLPSWFQSGELEHKIYTPKFEIDIKRAEILGEGEGFLIKLGAFQSMDSPGGACFFVFDDEKSVVFPVFSGFDAYFPTLRDFTNCFLDDWTNDGIDEIIVHNWHGVRNGTLTIKVFDISSLYPKALPFMSAEQDSINMWNAWRGDSIVVDGKVNIPVRHSLGQCPWGITRYFEWNGEWFEVQDVKIKTESGYAETDFRYCMSSLIGFAEEQDTPQAIQVLDEIVSSFSSSADLDKNLLDEVRIRKGLVYLLANQPEQARLSFLEVAENPIARDGIWSQPAKNFLRIYQSPGDLYRACSALTVCDPTFDPTLVYPPEGRDDCLVVNPCYRDVRDLIMLEQGSGAKTLQQFVDNLENAGVEIPQTGWTDLDSDGRDELWFVFEPPTQRYWELWIASEHPGGVQTFYISIGSREPFDLVIEPLALYRARLSMGDYLALLWLKDEETGIASLEEWTDNPYLKPAIVRDDLKTFEELHAQFFRDGTSAGIYEEMFDIAARYETCPYEMVNLFSFALSCGDYYFTLGLVAELNEDWHTAEQQYARVLDFYPNHPVALLCRIKTVKD